MTRHELALELAQRLGVETDTEMDAAGPNGG